MLQLTLMGQDDAELTLHQEGQVPHRQEPRFSPPVFSEPQLCETVNDIKEKVLHIHTHKEHYNSYCTRGDDKVHFSRLRFVQVEV